MANKQHYVYELELFHSSHKTYYMHVGVAKMALWAIYMKSDIKDLKEVKVSWRQLTDEWSITGVGEIRPIIPAEGLTYADCDI